MNMDYRRLTIAASVVAVLIMVAVGYIQGDMAPAMIFLVITGLILGLLLWSTRPRLSDAHISHAAAHTAASDADVIVYWRPG